MWFTKLTGIAETTLPEMQSQLTVEGETLISQANGRHMALGRFAFPTLADLRQQTADLRATPRARTTLSETFGDVSKLHAQPDNNGALFQAASQFNLLEMVGPSVTPEKGLNIYVHDRTQGPICAMACGAGTIWRALLMPLEGGAGQTAKRQADGAAGLGQIIGGTPWDMRNGYLMPRPGGLEAAAQAVARDADALRAALRIGLHFDTEVTHPDAPEGQRVAQAYCSACPVAYAGGRMVDWQPLAQTILEATYEATLHAALLNAETTGNRRVILTQVGGGVFGNDPGWIVAAIHRALGLFEHSDLDVQINSYNAPDPRVAALIRQWRSLG